MNKKYKIINSNMNQEQDSDCENYLDIFIYIILFSIVFYLIYKFIFVKEPFENTYTQNGNTETINKLQQENKELTNFKDTVSKKIDEFDRANFLATNYNKVDPASYTKELDLIYNQFENTDFPTTDLTKYKVISNELELNNIIDSVSKFKNFYKPGEIVAGPSSIGIDKNIICYQDKGKLLKTDPDFLAKYPECMVCATNDSPDLKDTIGWKNTKTNISEVCLFNPNPEQNSPVPNLTDCKKFCNIK
jgi:hypothetical protein